MVGDIQSLATARGESKLYGYKETEHFFTFVSMVGTLIAFSLHQANGPYSILNLPSKESAAAQQAVSERDAMSPTAMGIGADATLSPIDGLRKLRLKLGQYGADADAIEEALPLAHAGTKGGSGSGHDSRHDGDL